MDKILIVEDSQTVAKYLARRLETSLDDVEIHTADSFDTVKKLLATDKHYSLALLDVFLPDMHDTQLIDFVLGKKIPVVVMTSDYDMALQKQLLQKEIADFVLKDSVEALEYIVAFTERLLHNRETSVLIVDDSTTALRHIGDYLKRQLYQVHTERDPLHALMKLTTDDTISIVITDYNMPQLNGVQFLQKIRRFKSKDDLGVIGISADSESATKFLKFGANDFINKPFMKEEFLHRVNNLAQNLENIKTLKTYANQDFLTKVHNRKYFFEKGIFYLDRMRKEKKEFAVAMIDIDDFKKVNDTYGHDIGDKVIKTLAKKLKQKTKGQDLVARFGGEEFCLFLQDISENAAQKFFEELRREVASTPIETGISESIYFTVSIGIATKPHNTLEEMIKQADIYLYEAKQSGKNRVVSDIPAEVS